MDQTEEGRRLKMMPIVDEYARECLHLGGREEHHRRRRRNYLGPLVPAAWGAFLHPLGQRSRVYRHCGQTMAGCLRGRDSLHRAGKPLGERLQRDVHQWPFGEELLKREVFADLLEAKVLVEDYRSHHNHRRPHSGWGTGSGGVRGGRRSRQEGGGCRKAKGGVRIGPQTLIAPATENGVRPLLVS